MLLAGETPSTTAVATYTEDVGRHVKQGKPCAVKGIGPKCSALKPSSLVSVTACQGKAAVCQGLKVLSPDILEIYSYASLCSCLIHQIYIRYTIAFKSIFKPGGHVRVEPEYTCIRGTNACCYCCVLSPFSAWDAPEV